MSTMSLLQAKKKDARLVAIVVFLIFAVFFSMLYTLLGLNAELRDVKAKLGEIQGIPAVREAMEAQKILSNLQGMNETKGYPRLVSLEELSSGDIRALEAQQPVIYNSLPEKTLYRAVLSNENESLFVIYDLEENRILRNFALSQMQLGQ